MQHLRILILLIVVGWTADVFCQEEEPFPFHEFYGGVTRSNVSDNSTEDGVGWAVSMVSEIEDSALLRMALEFGLLSTAQHKDRGASTRFSSESDVDLRFTFISIGLLGRQYFDHDEGPFFEFGLFADIPVAARKTSTTHSYVPIALTDSTWTVNDQVTRGKGRVSGFVNGGPQFGIGWRFPTRKFELRVRANYRAGLSTPTVDGNYDIRTSYLQLHLGIRLPNSSEPPVTRN